MFTVPWLSPQADRLRSLLEIMAGKNTCKIIKTTAVTSWLNKGTLLVCKSINKQGNQPDQGAALQEHNQLTIYLLMLYIQLHQIWAPGHGSSVSICMIYWAHQQPDRTVQGKGYYAHKIKVCHAPGGNAIDSRGTAVAEASEPRTWTVPYCTVIKCRGFSKTLAERERGGK